MSSTNKTKDKNKRPIVNAQKESKNTKSTDTTNEHSGKNFETEKPKTRKQKTNERKTPENHPQRDQDAACFLNKQFGGSMPAAMKGKNDIYVYAVQSTMNLRAGQSKPDMEFIIYIPIDSDFKEPTESGASSTVQKEQKSPTPDKPKTSIETTPAETKLNYKVPVKSRRPTGHVRKSLVPSTSDSSEASEDESKNSESESEDSETEQNSDTLKSTASKRAVTFAAK